MPPPITPYIPFVLHWYISQIAIDNRNSNALIRNIVVNFPDPKFILTEDKLLLEEEILKNENVNIIYLLYWPELSNHAEKELTKAEYMRLVNTAKQKGNERLNLILQTICGTGIRVSELQYITVEAVKCSEAVVSLKGKTRSVFIVKELQKKLLRYAAEQKIHSGCIFITRTGKPISRTNIWREMKGLCEQAGVNPQKVFPHNLRHLFARIFYGIEKDIAKLADILGHSSINTTRIYIISTGDEHRKRMEHMRLII